MTIREEINRCPVYRKCGGCQLDVTYPQQLSYKMRTAIDLLGRFHRVEQIIGMEDPLHYRCKVSSAFGFSRGHAITGIWQASAGKLVQVDQCMLEDLRAKKVVDTVRALIRPFRLRTYDERTGSGVIRFVMVRIGKQSGEILVALGTGSDEFPRKRDFVKELVKQCPSITTVVQCISTDRLNLVLGKEETVLYGKGYITDTLCGYEFQISARSFFQINPVQTEKLYTTAVEFAGLTGKETVIDAYCGVGTIGIIASDEAKQVISCEVNGEAVKNAIENVKRNGIENVRVLKADAGEFMEAAAEEDEQIDVVFTDPPRAGCSRQFLAALARLAPKKVVYISCNPETLARDLRYLTQNGYAVDRIRPVDMFPYTKHIECVVALSYKG